MEWGIKGFLSVFFVNLSCKKYSKQLDWIRTRRLKSFISIFNIPLHFSTRNMRRETRRQSESRTGLVCSHLVLNNQTKHDGRAAHPSLPPLHCLYYNQSLGGSNLLWIFGGESELRTAATFSQTERISVYSAN